MSDLKTTQTGGVMDTEPGGENTAYESQKTFTAIPEKNVASQYRGEDGTVNLPTHRVIRPKDIHAKGKAEEAKEGEEEGEGGEKEGSSPLDALKDGKGEVHLPTHNKVTPQQIRNNATKAGEAKEEGEGEEDVVVGKHLPTHNKVRMEDIKNKAANEGGEEDKDTTREMMGYGKGNDVGA